MHRRDFLRTGLALGGAALASTPGCATAPLPANPSQPAPASTDSWAAFRAGFDRTHDEVDLSGFLLAPHHRSVREAIEVYRRALDANPFKALKDYSRAADTETCRAAASYLDVKPEEIAITTSTTMGLGLVYGGLKLREGQEVLTTPHEHYSTDTSLRLRAERTGATLRHVSLYTRPEAASEGEIVQALLSAITPRTRVLALTWVHSCSGVKLPIRAISDALAGVNGNRAGEDRVLLCVDGVHGLGSEVETLPQLGCDFFIAGCHKWMFGPRGTGFIWGRTSAWDVLTPTIPTFYSPAVRIWAKDIPPQELPPGPLRSPGGFHAFEHRWALGKAFELHQRLGRSRVTERIHALNRQAKEELTKMRHVRLRTPMADELSAGIICFEVEGRKPDEVVHLLEQKRVIATETPYATKYVRISLGLLNTPEDVEAGMREIRALA
ncbi:aminotransferase class V-fold PLP-dependent enzyme [Archangium violaceum]|uniref:aminotransferase class V-fold PLP-dependent enzyme n=1 Tax=Archangium violaceum TaxID=83451 RepID=UPI00193B7275|nr:aminotransferase class V-fold PLP-dependent enzyme [Archangium violaceum]QRK11323.1 aminotransferase class V-fold PLP-dependent enzyme [Archangium violaceum]